MIGANGGGTSSIPSAKTLVMEGKLTEFELPSILQVVSIGRQLTSVELADTEDTMIGSIAIKSGQVVQARLRQRGGADAFFDLLETALENFRVYRMPTPAQLPEPIGSVGNLLMKAMARSTPPSRAPSQKPAKGRTRASSQSPARRPASARAPSASPAAPSSRPASAPEPRASRPASSEEPPTNVRSFRPAHETTANEPCIVAIASPKGGVGKTTITLNLALSVARQGRRVVLVDADLNGDVMSAIAARDRVRVGAYDLLDSNQPPAEALIATMLPELKILPACGPDAPASVFESRDRRPQWKRLLTQLAQQSDLVLVDTAAGMLGNTQQVLSGCTHLVGIVQCEVIARRSFAPNFMRGLEVLGSSRPEVAGVLLNMFQRDQSPSLSVLQDVTGELPSEWLFDTTIPRTPAFLEATEAGLPLRLLDERSPPSVTWLFDMLATELTQRVRLERAKKRRRAFLV